MLDRLARLTYWLALSLLASGALATPPLQSQSSLSPAPTLNIDGVGKGTANLDGPWQFHTGDNPAWAEPIYPDQSWETISADQPWGAQPTYENYTGYAWYRRHIRVTAAPNTAPDLAVLIEHIDDAYELYWNGTLIGSNGKLPPHPTWYNDQPAQTYGLGPIANLTSNHSANQTTAVLAVRVWKAPLVSYDSGQSGGFTSPPKIGSPEAIAALKAALDYRWLRVRQFTFALDCLYALVGLLSLLTWLRNRTAKILLWMAGFSLAPIAILFLDGLRLKLPFDLSLGLQQPLYSLEDISLWFMLLWFLDLNDSRKLLRLTWIFAAINLSVTTLDGLLVFFGWSSSANQSWNRSLQIVDGLCSGLYTLTEVWPLGIVVFAVLLAVRGQRHLEPTRWLVALTAFLTVSVSVLQVAAAQGSRYTHWTLADRIAGPLFTINGNPISAYTLFRTLLVLALINAVYRYYADTSRRRTSLEQELQSVRELQQVLIPDTPPSVPGFTLTGAYRPAQEVGGDFFQIIPIGTSRQGSGSTLIILGDVSGKGLKAAMAVAVILGAARALAPFFTDPALLLGELNQSLQGRLQGAFATCIILRVDHTGLCLISTAGHPSPFLNDQELTLPGALPLALSPSASYEDTTLQLKVDDRLALYTDGLLEARNPAGELFSFDRLQQLFATNPTAEQATEAAVQFGQDDDITVLTLTRRPANFKEPLYNTKSLSETQTIRIYPAS